MRTYSMEGSDYNVYNFTSYKFKTKLDGQKKELWPEGCSTGEGGVGEGCATGDRDVHRERSGRRKGVHGKRRQRGAGEKTDKIRSRSAVQHTSAATSWVPSFMGT